MRTIPLCTGTALLLLSLGSYAAAPAEDAQRHFAAVAAGRVDDIMAAYADKAHFEWIGGPLNGTYVGTDQIRGVWSKFAKANTPLTVKATKLEESGNTAGTTLTANVEFKGKNTIKVRYVLVYRDGKLVDEVWQVDPKLTVAQY